MLYRSECTVYCKTNTTVYQDKASVLHQSYTWGTIGVLHIKFYILEENYIQI